MMVVKLGGAAGIDPDPLLDELAALDGPWVLVHGGNDELTRTSERLGHAPRFVTSPSGHESRVTDAETLAHIQMVYRGRINNDLVLRLQRRGVAAIGLSGIDGGLWRAVRKDAIRVMEGGRQVVLRGDLTGRIHTVNADLLRLLLDHGYRPVLTLPALADDGEAVNVDGDRAAAAVAAALGADELVMLSNVPGLLRDPDDPATLIGRIPRTELADHERYARGRYRKKLMGVEEALDAGVGHVLLGTANAERPIASARAGHGTWIG